MSLINEALKKAQKLRTGEPGTMAPMPGGNTRVTKRNEPRSTQQLIVIAAGALVLILLSVVATFWFVNRAPEPKPAIKTAMVRSGDPIPPSSTPVAPAIKTPPAADTSPAKPKAAPLPAPPANATPSPANAALPPSSPTNGAPDAPVKSSAEAGNSPAAPAPTDPRVHAYIDAIKVMGIRSSGGDSRVLMNDRVFRVNDIVERSLGVRLTNVAADALTFTDSNGAIYVKNF